MIYFVIVNYHSSHYIQKLITSLLETGNQNYQIIIINNSPTDTSIQKLENQFIKVIEAPTNLGFGCGCNLGLEYIYQHDKNALVWMINPDTYVNDRVVESVYKFFHQHPDVSILGTMTLTPNQDIWFAGGTFNQTTGAIASTNLLTNTDTARCDWVSGCSLIVNLHNFSECPLFDPAYFLYYEDFDFCRRYVLSGHQICITKKITIYHVPSSITNQYTFRKIKHSTFGYLLTLERYTNNYILSWRLFRLLIHALILLPMRSPTALGKFSGIFSYFYKRYFQVMNAD